MQTLVEAFLQALRLVTTFDPAVVEIARLSLEVTLTAVVISAVVGIPLGAWFALTTFSGRRILTALIYTGMGLPPVVVGLVVYLFLSRSGPLGDLGWLFSFEAMVVAQSIIATPLILGVTMSSVMAIPYELRLQLRSLGATGWQTTWAVLWEARFGVIVGLVAGFGSIISEVGAVMLVGGNIEGRTRVLTTAIVLETRQGKFDVALALGIILLTLSFVSNFALVLLQQRTGAAR
ncbi:MAG: ABC transporter permease [Anaerolineae bacterium]|nr:ABC transporter permease [Anaerolineae bacterium]